MRCCDYYHHLDIYDREEGRCPNCGRSAGLGRPDFEGKFL
jgi:hypothetical protein